MKERGSIEEPEGIQRNTAGLDDEGGNMIKDNETKYLKDYEAPLYCVPEISLNFDLYNEYVRVKSALTIKADFQSNDFKPLILNGVDLKLISIAVNGNELEPDEFEVNSTSLIIFTPPRTGVVSIEVEIYPMENASLEGLYCSDGIFCTQNEPEGFRKITFFPDRPDVMSIFTTSITADKQQFPYLLSNGNPVKSGDLPDNRHFVTWHDPFPKPSYIFALVAADLGMIGDSFKSNSGRTVQLKVFVDKGNEKKARHAMESLKKVMKWDEETFGLEYGLDVFMIVAVDAFNFGAMENKGLNIFNSTYALADPESATDTHFMTIESFVAHEFLHNWSGNRVTCRDWFQLTLKEGLTVFRDNEYSSDLYSRAVKRIEVVSGLRDNQFNEDSGPLAHPIRPESYVSINNFYTTTVFQKGKEVIKMLDTMIGRDQFRKALTKYFRRYDGQAVTTEDFLDVMEEESNIDLTQFKNWYHLAGTPLCKVSGSFNGEMNEYTLSVQQSCRPTGESSGKDPFHFPLKIGLLNPGGDDMDLNIKGNNESFDKRKSILHITKKEETFTFSHIRSKPVPSLLRDFSAPVKLEYDYSDNDLIFLLGNDSDKFNRYEAGQRLALNTVVSLAEDERAGIPLKIHSDIPEAYSLFVDRENNDLMFCSKVLKMPDLANVANLLTDYDVDSAFKAREYFLKLIAQTHREKLLQTYEELQSETYSNSISDIAGRSLKNVCLGYLGLLDGEYKDLVYNQFLKADNMTDVSASLAILADEKSPMRDDAFEQFYHRWKNDKQVINQWFSLQAGGKCEAVYDSVLKLECDPIFEKLNPNKFRSLFGTFANNLINFHHSSGRGYQLISDKIIEMDNSNPIVAAGLCKTFSRINQLDKTRKGLMEAEMARILKKKDLSPNLHEIIDILMK